MKRDLKKKNSLYIIPAKFASIILESCVKFRISGHRDDTHQVTEIDVTFQVTCHLSQMC